MKNVITRKHMLLNMDNIIPLWKLHSILEMLAQSPRLAWSSTTSWLMVPSTGSTPPSLLARCGQVHLVFHSDLNELGQINYKPIMVKQLNCKLIP
jgi:hypothetical protein